MTAPAAAAPPGADLADRAGSDRGPGPKGARLPHVEALDGLRGAAVAAVLLHHAGHLTGGWLGVDLFFVLSGYLITALLLQGWRDKGSVALGTFWARRVRRLGPALVLLLLGVAVYAAVIALPSEMGGIRSDGLATLFEVANVRTIASGGDYWATMLRPSPLRHTWSLAIEEQLYLVWPLVVAGLLRWRRSPRAVLVAAIAAAIGSAALMEVLFSVGVSRSRLYYGTDTRAAAVMLGAALAAGRVTMGPARWAATRPTRHAVGAVAAVLLALAWWRLDGSESISYQLLPLIGVLAALVVASVADRRHPGPVGRVLVLPPIPALGRISYGVYLFHWPIFLVVDEARTGLGGWALTGVRVAITVAVAAASYRWVEEPIRNRRFPPPGRPARAAVPAAAAVVIIALVAATLGASARPLGMDDAGGSIDRSSVAGAPVVLLAGDSVPLLLGVELKAQRDELGVSVLNQARPGCHLLAAVGPIRGTEGDVRTDINDCTGGDRYRDDVARFHPDVSVLLFGEFPNEAVQLDGRWIMPCQDEYLELWRAKLDEVVADLGSGGAPVVLLTAPGTSIDWILESVEPGMPERVRCTNDVLADVARDTPGVHVIDLAAHVCPPDRSTCLQDIDGADLRPDGLHFSGDGAAVINAWLAPQLQQIAAEGASGPGG